MLFFAFPVAIDCCCGPVFVVSVVVDVDLELLLSVAVVTDVVVAAAATGGSVVLKEF